MRKRLFTQINCCLLLLTFCFLAVSKTLYSADTKDFYQIRVYYLKSNEQMQQVDQFLKNVYLPALHRAGISKVGVFKPIANDTSATKSVYVFIPFNSAEDFLRLNDKLEKDDAYKTAGNSFFEAPADNAPYYRMESILLEAFPMHTHFNLPSLKAKNTERVYELRSYESPTESLFEKKVNMFNRGDEIGLFKRLNFNAIFYARVISGCHMPNLMYMTSFESIEDREAHWKAFGEDPQWKQFVADPQYESKVSVSHIDSILMHPSEYSDI